MPAVKRTTFATLLAGSVRPYVLPLLAATFLSLAALILFQRVERFLSFHPRFTVSPPPPGGLPSPSIQVRGASLASDTAIRAVFTQDAGRSVFLVPLADRGESISRVPWVESARVSRIWPNRIEVAVKERRPVAFAHIESGRRSHASIARLIDASGELLPIVKHRRYNLPVLLGVQEQHDRAHRAELVAIMARLLEELGSPGKRVSEVDLRNPENVAVVYPTDTRAIRLILGGRDWKKRMEKFMRHYPEIRENMPHAIELDLRLDEWIPVTQWEAPDAE
jgi:cell division protein FtsQ